MWLAVRGECHTDSWKEDTVSRKQPQHDTELWASSLRALSVSVSAHLHLCSCVSVCQCPTQPLHRFNDQQTIRSTSSSHSSLTRRSRHINTLSADIHSSSLIKIITWCYSFLQTWHLESRNQKCVVSCFDESACVLLSRGTEAFVMSCSRSFSF